LQTRRRWLAIGTAVVAAVAVAVALALARKGGGEDHPGPLDHHDYALLWQQTHLGEARDAVLARWPTVPDEHYIDNLKDDCFEWSDERRYIYNLCFNAGILRSKELI
jgi:hypothetical protein